ncbi:MAG TPA: universal stress protein [Blastocatellia bacterium]|nr:universal stress protein [Blastocatellia bacterium]
MKILLATDGSAFSDAAVEEVARRPWPEGSEVRVISVFEPPVPPTTDTWVLPGDYYEQLEQAAEEEARRAVNKAIEKITAVAGDKLKVSSEVIRGNPKQAILDEAEKWGADLIVLGSHGYRGLTKFLLGSVSQAVASHAKCSVEIVRSRNRPES